MKNRLMIISIAIFLLILAFVLNDYLNNADIAECVAHGHMYDVCMSILRQ